MQRIGAVILAAGESARFGKPKQLIRHGGKSLVRGILDAAQEADCSPIAVVVGSDSEGITRELQKTNVAIVPNRNWERGIGSSIRTGVLYLIDTAKDIDAIMLLVCDQPFVNARVIRELVALYTKTGKPIAASSYAKTLGVPALFDRTCFQELLTLDDASGAKSVILASSARIAKYSFPKGEIDIDSMKDLATLQRKGST